MNISENGKNLIKSYEGCRLTAYKVLDSEQFWTIGWGHYGSDVYPGMVITQAKADAMFDNDIVSYVDAVRNHRMNFSLNQNQFDALCSFAYNLGVGIIRDFDGKTASQVANEMTLYVNSGGTRLQGLVNRRNKEIALFNTPVVDSNKRYLNLKPHMQTWSVYNSNGPYIKNRRIGDLAPAQFGGLSYEILDSKGNDVYIIQTRVFGRVAIWAPRDNDSSISSLPVY